MKSGVSALFSHAPLSMVMVPYLVLLNSVNPPRLLLIVHARRVVHPVGWTKIGWQVSVAGISQFSTIGYFQSKATALRTYVRLLNPHLPSDHDRFPRVPARAWTATRRLGGRHLPNSLAQSVQCAIANGW